jgi:GxxExxY protein
VRRKSAENAEKQAQPGCLRVWVFFAISAAFLSDLSGTRLSVSFREQEGVFFTLGMRQEAERSRVSVEIGKMLLTQITSQIIGSAIKVHRRLGPGLLESAYEACLAYELERVGLHVQRQKAVPLVYEMVKLECGFRTDMVVEGLVVVEIKCKEVLHPVDQAQLLSYLRLLNLQVGLLINFHVAVLKDGIKRMVNSYQELPEDHPQPEQECIYR